MINLSNIGRTGQVEYRTSPEDSFSTAPSHNPAGKFRTAAEVRYWKVYAALREQYLQIPSERPGPKSGSFSSSKPFPIL